MCEIVIGFCFEHIGCAQSENEFTQLGASAHELESGKKIAGFNMYATMKDLNWIRSGKGVIDFFVKWARKVSKDRHCVIISNNMIFDGRLLKFYSNVDVIYILGRNTLYYEFGYVYMGVNMHKKKKCLDQEYTDISHNKSLSHKTEKGIFPKTDVYNTEKDAEYMVTQWIYVMNNQF
jgi:hypothetical protein